MRFLLGVMMGILLTVGFAYVVDLIAETPSRQMVNWEVAKERMRGLTSSARSVRDSVERGIDKVQ